MPVSPVWVRRPSMMALRICRVSAITSRCRALRGPWPLDITKNL